MKTFEHFLIAIVAICCLSGAAVAAPGIRVVADGPSDLSGRYAEKVVDMEVKVAGGNLSVVRAYRDGAWIFNPGYDLPDERPLFATTFAPGVDSPLSPGGTTSAGGCAAGCHSAGSIPQSNVSVSSTAGLQRVVVGSILHRNGDFYRHNDVVKDDLGDGTTRITERFINVTATRFLTRVSIDDGETRTLESVSWHDVEGHFMHYDAAGVTEWGDRYGVTNKIARDAQGRISQVKDHADRVIFTYAYVDDTERVASVTDLAGRVVTYTYNEAGRLTEVTDVRGKVWHYNYDVGYLKTDPDGRSVSVQTGADNTVVLIDRGGAITRYSFGFNPTTDLPNSVTSTSPSGVRNSKNYDGSNRLVSQRVNGVEVRRIEREKQQDLTSVETETDETGYAVTRTRNGNGQVSSVEYPDGTTELYTYHAPFQFVQSFTNRKGVKTQYTYDSNGNHTRLIEAVGTPHERTTTFEYDALGQLIRTTWVGDGNTPTVTNEWTYDAVGNIATFTDGEGNVEQYQNYDITGNYHTLIDGNNKTWLLDYDDAGNLVSLTNPLGKTTTLAYDGAGNLTSSTLPTTAVTALAYDAQSRLNKVTDALGKVTELNIDDTTRTLTVTDALHNTVQMTQNPFDQIKQLVDPTGNVTTLNYDARRLTGIDFPTFTQTVEYDNDNRIDTVTNVLGSEGGGAANQTTALDYDAVGNLIATLDAEGNGYAYSVDVLDRIITITDPVSGTIIFEYDRRGNLTRVQDPEGRETRFEYNGNDQLVAEVIGTDPNTTRREYDYDGNGNLTEIITPEGGRITFTYNDAGQLTVSNVYIDTVAATPEKTITFGRDDIGRLTSYSDGTTSATYSYDAVDRVTSVTTDFGPFSKTYSYTYYDNGWIRTYTNPENVIYTYTYNADGTLASVAIPGEGQVTLSDYQWLAPQTMTLPGGTTLTSNYDALLRLDSYTVTDPAGQTIASGIYSYDKVNNILSIVTEDDTKDYGYDDLYRLTGADFAQLDDEAYSYDGVGNRLSSTDEPTWLYNDKNQLTSHGTTTYEYDDNGNRIKKTENGTDTHYIYNTEERLIRVEDHNHSTIASYYYDPFGLRLYKDVSGARTYFLYNGEGLAAEYDATGNLIAEYHYGPNKPWMTDPLFQRRDNQVTYYQTDHLGTPQKLITKSGQVVWQGRYEAFGAITVTINTVDNPLRFPGQYADQETGTDYNYFRNYDPVVSAYIQSDPLGLYDGPNTYTYVYNNPVNYTDPTGEFGVAGALIGGGIDLFLQLSQNGWSLSCVNPWQVAGAAALGAVTGGLGSAAGRQGLTAGLKGLSNQTKGAIGEALSTVKHTLRGSRRLGT